VTRFLRTPLALPGAALAAGCLLLAPHALHRQHRIQGLHLTAAIHGFGLKAVAVTGLYPGKVKSMTVHITNPYGYSIRIKPLTATVAKATGKSGCVGGPANLQVDHASSKTVVVRAHKTVNAVVRVTMPGSVVNACQGARFAISLRSSATKT
jgi:hypothetical protein